MNRTVIESFEQFSDLIVSFRKEHPDTLSNLPLNKKSFQRFIDERALTCLSDEDGLYFLYDEIGFYTLYYLVAETDRLHIEKQDKDLLLNLNYVVKEGEADRDLDPLYVNSGFERLALNYNYILDFDEYKDMILEKREEADKALAEKHLHIVEKDPDQPEARDLWTRYLKNTDIPRDHLHSGRLLCIEDEEGKTAGVAWYRNENGECELRHLVVDEGFRGLGLAKILTHYRDYKGLEGGMKRARSWIENTNVASTVLHLKMGYVRTNRINEQYILRA